MIKLHIFNRRSAIIHTMLFWDRNCVNIIEAIRLVHYDYILTNPLVLCTGNISVCIMGQIQRTSFNVIYQPGKLVEILFSPHCPQSMFSIYTTSKWIILLAMHVAVTLLYITVWEYWERYIFNTYYIRT